MFISLQPFCVFEVSDFREEEMGISAEYAEGYHYPDVSRPKFIGNGETTSSISFEEGEGNESA